MFFAVVLSLLGACAAQSGYSLPQTAAPQVPPIWDALDVLRGRLLTVAEIQDIVASAVPGQSYPINAVAPEPGVDCSKAGLPGYFADDGPVSRCQAFYRCDIDGQRTAFLCPNGTLFNQITLVCDSFYNVDCQNSAQFATYANARLYVPGAHLHDDQLEYNPGTTVPGAHGPPAPRWKPSESKAAAGKTNQRLVVGGAAQSESESADAAVALDAEPMNNRVMADPMVQNRVKVAPKAAKVAPRRKSSGGNKNL